MNTHALTPPRRSSKKLGDFPGWVKEAGLGFSFLGRGMSFVWSRPKVALAAMLPAALASLLLTGLVVGVTLLSDNLVLWLTPWATDWHPTLAQIVRGVVALAIVVGVIFLCVVVFSTVTLMLGAPVFEHICIWVDRACGEEVAEVKVTAKARLKRAVADGFGGARLSLQRAVLVGVVGFIPIIGSLMACLMSVCYGGWLITLDLVSIPFERRGAGSLSLRRAWVRYRMALCLGFGIPVYLSFLVPVLSVIVFPGVVAGASLLVRELLGQSTLLKSAAVERTTSRM